MEHKTSFQMKKNKALVIVGTDTGVGKTIISASFMAYLGQEGLKAAVMKPIESGCAWNPKRKSLIPADASFLKKISKLAEPIEKINPFTLKAPLAPAVAAKLENKKINFKKILKLKKYFLEKYPYLILEMAGGLLVPLTSKQTNLDLIKKLDCPVLLVAKAGLGTINHSLLTLKVLEMHGVKVVGIILNHHQQQKDLSVKTNLKTLQAWSNVPVWGEFPFVSKSAQKHSAERLALLFKKYLGSAFHKYLSWS